MQHTMEATSVEAIEHLTGRRVYSFMSGNDPARELQAEVFVLEPEPTESDPGAATAGENDDLGERARRARVQNRQVREDLRALRAEQAQSRAALKHERRNK